MMRHKIIFLSLWISGMLCGSIQAAGSMYSYADPASDRIANIWVPDNLIRVRGILLNGNGVHANATGQAYHPHKQAFCEKHGFALMATGFFYNFNDGIGGTDWNALTGAIGDVAARSGHPEMTNAPFVTYGMSNGGQMAYGLMYLIPDRTIAFCANKGVAYINDGAGPPVTVPGILIAGEADSSARRTSISNVYTLGRSQGAPWAWLEEENISHEDGNSEALLFGFYTEAIAQRYPADLYPTASSQPVLLPVVETNGWLVDQGTENWEGGFCGIQASADYSGNKTLLGWVPGEHSAVLYRAVASFDSSVNSSFNPLQKPLLTRFPINPIGLAKGRLYYPSRPVHYELDIDPAVTDWQKIEFYDGTNRLTEVLNEGINTVSAELILDDTLANNSLHAVLTLADHSKRTSSINMMQSDTVRTPDIPSALASSAATNGVATPVNTQTFFWALPTNKTWVAGYSYSLTEEPDEVTDTTGTSVSFTNLTDGTCTFKVRAKSSDSVWGPAAVFTLIVQSVPTAEVSTNALLVSEGGTASFDVFMSGPPLAGVTIRVARASGDTSLSVSSGAELLFTAATWETPQTVTLTAAEDNDATDSRAVFEIAGPGVVSASVTATEIDDDLAIQVSSNNLIVDEGGTTDFLVRLNSAPPAPHTVSVSRVSGDSNISISSGASLIFTAADYMNWQTSVVAAAQDSDQTDGTATIQLSAPAAANVNISVTENDDDYTVVASGLLAAWNLDSISSSPTVTGTNAYFMATGLVQSVLTHSDTSEMRGANNALKAIDNDGATFTEAISGGNYFYWQLAPKSNYVVTVTSVVFRTKGDGTVGSFLLSDASGIHATQALATNGATASLITIDLSSRTEFEQRATAIEFRIYGYLGADAYKALYIGNSFTTDNSDDILVYGTVAYSLPASANEDSDTDGLPDDWEIQYFGGATNADANATASNGINTVYQSYIAGLDPTEPDSIFRILNSGNILHWQSVSGRVYSIEWSTNLLNGFQPLETNLSWNTTNFTDAAHLVEDALFYRINVQLEE